MRKRLPASFYNGTTLFGGTLALVMLSLILFLIVIDTMSSVPNSYMGLITYIALPAVMLFGLFIAAIGAIRTHKRIKRGEGEPHLPILNLNLPRHRFLATSFGIGGMVMIALSSFGSYQAYEYTESVQFCGTTCHIIMKPEYTAYQHSPHAKVTCAGCHIGSGATWYVKSKFSGAYQVYSTLFNKYSTPIETPVHNLRPAKETCEQCHWPKFFYSRKLISKTYYLGDEENTRHDLDMLLRIGGSKPGKSEGIHAHMYLDSEVSYISTDKKRQVIPYVEMKDKSGKVTVYRDTDANVSDADLKKGERRTIDCIDCHNRPTHIFHPADKAVNDAMALGLIDPKIPMIKATAVEVMEKEYKAEPEALAGIARDVRAYYKENYPDHPACTTENLNKAVAAIQDAFKHNYFPEMKSNWKAFPSNLDHMHSSGCFRCHDDKHKSPTGKVISKNCNTCHTFVSQKAAGQPVKESFQGQEFVHPADIGDAWKTEPCMSCHGPQEPE